MSLHNRVSPQTEVHLMVQRREGALKPLPDGKTWEEMENEEINFINVLDPRDPELMSGGASLLPSPLQAVPEVETREPMAPPLYDKG